jgi:hypothetical protein
MEEIKQKKYIILNISNKNFEVFDSTRILSNWLKSNDINISHTTINRRLTKEKCIILDPYIIKKISLT